VPGAYIFARKAQFLFDLMFAYIQGKITHLDPTYVIIDVHGLGYEIKISLHTYQQIQDKDTCKLLTYLHIKEDAHTLFGFFESAEKNLFLDLLSISGVGTGTALMLLSSMRVGELKQAIAYGEVKSIQNVKGIGAKTAQRIVLELKDKILKEGAIGETTAEKLTGTFLGAYNTLRNEALTALVTLGMNKVTAEKSIDKVLSDWKKQHADSPILLENLIKLALKNG
jgi:holliday junction DNA helicase RuvA